MAEIRYNKSIVKNINESLIRKAIQGEEAFTKTKIARDTGLSFPTVSRILDEMAHFGEILSNGVDQTTGGRHAQSYVINPAFAYVLCLYMPTNTALRALIINSLGDRVKSDDIEETVSPENFIEVLDGVIAKEMEDYPIRALSLGLPYGISYGKLMFGTGETGLRNYDLQQHLEEKFGIKARIENDMNAIATGCYERTFQEDFRSLACVSMGVRGCGCGLYLRGHLIRGNHGFAGELRYLPMGEDFNLDKEYQTELWESVSAIRVAQIVASICCTVDPQMIVFYDRMNIREIMPEVRELCKRFLPEEVIPELVVSDKILEDFENGLIRFGRDMLMAGYEIVNR